MPYADQRFQTSRTILTIYHKIIILDFSSDLCTMKQEKLFVQTIATLDFPIGWQHLIESEIHQMILMTPLQELLSHSISGHLPTKTLLKLGQLKGEDLQTATYENNFKQRHMSNFNKNFFSKRKLCIGNTLNTLILMYICLY